MNEEDRFDLAMDVVDQFITSFPEGSTMNDLVIAVLHINLAFINICHERNIPKPGMTKAERFHDFVSSIVDTLEAEDSGGIQ